MPFGSTPSGGFLSEPVLSAIGLDLLQSDTYSGTLPLICSFKFKGIVSNSGRAGTKPLCEDAGQ